MPSTRDRTDIRAGAPAPEPLMWLRAETRRTERRTPLVPGDVARLIARGVQIVVERSEQRVSPDADYENAGACLADPGSWVDAEPDAFILGLKELPAEPTALRHRHVFFGHAYKGQPGADALLARFASGGGELLDLEYLRDEHGRRLVAFGHWAGYVGAALAILHWNGRLVAPLQPMSRRCLDDELAAAPTRPTMPRVLVLGALGRSGRGARAALEHAGVPTTAWDVEQTRELDRRALLGHDIIVNTVLTTVPGEPFLTPEHLTADGRRLAVLSDVTCDVGSPCNLFPLYDDTTTWQAPVRRLPGLHPPLDTIVIDNLPSLLPLEASTSFSAALWPLIPALADRTGVWQSCRGAFRQVRSTPEQQELSNV